MVLGVLDRAAFSVREGGRKCQISRFMITNILYLLNQVIKGLPEEELRKHLIISTMTLKKIKPYEFKSVQQSILKILKNPRIVNQVIQNG